MGCCVLLMVSPVRSDSVAHEPVTQKFGHPLNPTNEASTPILSLKYQRSGCSPICSQCIGEADYVRARWDHELISACTQHGVLLLDTCPGCGDSITRERESITHCLHCNFSFANAKATPSEDFDLAISALIAGTVSKARGLLPEALQSGSPPPDIADFLTYLACHIQSTPGSGRTGKTPRPRTIQESRDLLRRAWSALEYWPAGVNCFIETRICEGEGRAVHQRLGRWLAVFQKQFEHSVGLQDISIKSGLLHADVVSILQDISHGLIRPTEVIPGAVGLAALRFDIREIRDHLTKQVTEPMLRVSDLVAFAGWKRDDIKEWIRGGFLRVHREQHGQQIVERIPLSALIEFLTRYIVLSDVSDALSTTTNYLLTTFKPAKIQPAVSAITGQPPARGLLVEKLAVVRGAQLRKPLIRKVSELEVFP